MCSISWAVRSLQVTLDDDRADRPIMFDARNGRACPLPSGLGDGHRASRPDGEVGGRPSGNSGESRGIIIQSPPGAKSA
jgi:hypothetical protein